MPTNVTKRPEASVPRSGYTTAEFARALPASVKTVQRMVAAGRIRAVRISARRIVIPATEMERLLASSGGN